MYTFRCVLNKCLSSCFSNFLDTLQIWPNLGGTPRLINEVQTICLSKYFCSIENRNLSVAGSSMNSTFSSQMIKQLCDVLNNILCPLWFFGANKCTQLVCRSPSSSPSRSHTSYVTESPKTLTTCPRGRAASTAATAAVVQFNEPRHCRDPHFGQPPSNVELRERGQCVRERDGEREPNGEAETERTRNEVKSELCSQCILHANSLQFRQIYIRIYIWVYVYLNICAIFELWRSVNDTETSGGPGFKGEGVGRLFSMHTCI